MRISIPREREREIAPVGSHDAICYAVVDLGTQNTPYGAKRQLYVAWELPQERNSQGKPFVVGKFYNLTGDARGNLRQDLESWLGRVLDQAELEKLDLIETLVARTGTLGLVHQTGQNGQTRAVVNSIMLPRRGTPEWIPTTTAPITFGLEGGLDHKDYDELPEWLRNIVARSPEYQKAVAPEMAQGSTDERLKVHLGGGKEPASTAADADQDLNDAIPF